jgi:hypothetical protein
MHSFLRALGQHQQQEPKSHPKNSKKGCDEVKEQHAAMGGEMRDEGGAR